MNGFSLAVGVAVDLAMAALLFAAFVCLVLAAELAWPRGEIAGLKERWRAVTFGLVYIPAAILCAYLVRPVIGRPAFDLGFAAVLVVPFVWDFLYYWLHRAQHAIPLLWRFHAVHHSIERLCAGSGFHHWAEAPMRAVAVTIPLSYITSKPALVGAALGLHGLYIHSTTRLHFGPLAWVVADNRVHRIHHSTEPQHFDRNFGAFTPLWDRLFGTLHFPHDEWPTVGLADRREPRSLKEFAIQPFR